MLTLIHQLACLWILRDEPSLVAPERFEGLRVDRPGRPLQLRRLGRTSERLSVQIKLDGVK
jgi:hypothetical protein